MRLISCYYMILDPLQKCYPAAGHYCPPYLVTDRKQEILVPFKQKITITGQKIALTQQSVCWGGVYLFICLMGTDHINESQ